MVLDERSSLNRVVRKSIDPELTKLVEGLRIMWYHEKESDGLAGDDDAHDCVSGS